MSNVWATMPYVQLSHKVFVICIKNRQNQIFSEMSLRDVMELPNSVGHSMGIGCSEGLHHSPASQGLLIKAMSSCNAVEPYLAN